MENKGTDPVKIPGGTVHRLIGLLQRALIQLKADIDNEKIEKIGIMVHRAMSMQHRSFHTPEHIFNLADPINAHTTLAAIFHDVVYFQVDDGFHNEIQFILAPYIEEKNGSLHIRDEISETDREFWGTLSVFGFIPGQVLSPFAGLNEFLSALLMNHLLGGHVKDSDLLIATAAIEMTIPFRKPNSKGLKPAEILEGRIRETNRRFSLQLSQKQIEDTIRSSVVLSNRDIQNFAEKDPGKFLDNTWKLIPETNPELFFHGLYTIRSYSTALMKMEGFLNSLNPETVFQQYAGYPEKSEYHKYIQRTISNLAIAREYLGIKMISSGLLQALSDLTGGDVPVSFFMGDISPDDEWSRLATHLPNIESWDKEENHKNSILYRLLKYGRAGSSEFDLQNSPLSLFIYCCINREEQEDFINLSREYLKGQKGSLTYLQELPKYLVGSIARAASVMAFTRKENLLKIADSIEN